MSDVLVLCYHAVSQDWETPLAVTPAALDQQLRTLVELGYRGVPFGEAILSPPADKTLAVTFDHAFESVFELAAPVLAALGLPATVFVPTAFAGGYATWLGTGTARRSNRHSERSVMSWDQLRAVAQAGWEVGSQTVSYRSLTELDDEELIYELAGSRRECADQLGVPCGSLAYPYGGCDTRVMAAAADAGFAAAGSVPIRRFHAPLALNWPRVEVHRHDGRRRFAFKTAPRLRRLRTLYTEPPRPVHRGEGCVPPRPVHGARVAVIVPCFNDGELLVDAIDSIDEPEAIEIAVIDDASSDPATLKVLDSLRARGLRVVRHEHNQGLPAARMTGLRSTVAPYVFPLDADDLAVPGALTVMADCLDARAEAAVCFGDYLEFGNGEYVRTIPKSLDPYRVAFRNDYPVSSLFRRSVLESVGGWQAVGSEVGYEDWNLWMTLAERGAVGVHWGHGIALKRRVHGGRMLTDARRRHVALYLTLRTLHPTLFSQLPRHRRTSDLGPAARWLYPVIYGWRPPMSLLSRGGRLTRGVGTRIRALLDSA